MIGLARAVLDHGRRRGDRPASTDSTGTITCAALAARVAALAGAAEQEGALGRLRAFCEVMTTAEALARWRTTRA